jgi:hypothetical protein
MTLILSSEPTQKEAGNTPFPNILGHSDLAALVHQLPDAFPTPLLVMQFYLDLAYQFPIPNYKIIGLTVGRFKGSA